MSNLERILISIYFPQFRSPSCSRFENFFISIVKKKNPLNKNSKINVSKNIYPEKIVRNEDKRTSVEIKGIPMDMTKKEVRNFIEQYGNLNYLYITKDPNDIEKKSSIAYVNVINYKTILKIVQKFEQLKIFNSSEKDFSKVEIFYSGTQGKHALINRFSLEKKYLPPNQAISFS